MSTEVFNVSASRSIFFWLGSISTATFLHRTGARRLVRSPEAGNHFSNVVKYNRQGGIVGIDGLGITDRDIRIVVRDTGIGIPPDKHEELFQPFAWLGAQNSTIQGGSIGSEARWVRVRHFGSTLRPAFRQPAMVWLSILKWSSSQLLVQAGRSCRRQLFGFATTDRRILYTAITSCRRLRRRRRCGTGRWPESEHVWPWS